MHDVVRPTTGKGPSVNAPGPVLPVRDAELLEQCRRGDGAAFERLVRKYQDRIFNTCWRMSGNRADAEELTQETFVRAFQAIGRFDGRSEFFTWLYRIATNLAISHQRKRSRSSAGSLDRSPPRGAVEHGGGAATRAAGSGPSPEERALATERGEQVIAALAELDEEHRAVVVLRDVESLDYEQIADILEVPVGTVKSRLHRARMALRARLTRLMGDCG